ncbi:MAG: UvrD-helicase domain-containing protein [Actinomycetia bacterium]|nr:UvrD-helicase domain-containing protein [Actinomycetes bacterium]
MTFDLTAALPTGGLVLQASAGTGKTHTIATLATRYIAEGVATLPQLMVVTFSGASTRELRTRVRRRLQQLHRACLAPQSDDDPAWAAVLTAADPGLVRRRVVQALGSFDAAMICTTHQFCDRMLAELGILADHEPGTTLADDLQDLVREATGDEYLRRYAAAGRAPFLLQDAVRFCRAAVESPAAPLLPDPGTGTGAWRERVSLAQTVRELVEQRKRELRWYSFDDMQLRLLQALQHPVTGAVARERVRRRFPVVLVDEFQDTDPVQWQIISQTFAGDQTSTILIGDPKQSIYGFRGADVQAYLEAVRSSRVEVLDTNRRSTPALVTAVDAIFGGAALGDPRIVVEPVRAAGQTRLETTGPWRRAVRIRHTRQRSSSAFFRTAAADLVNDLVALLGSDAELVCGESRRRVRASDVAVIVHTNERGRYLLDQLTRHQVPAVFTGSRSVFAAPAAQDWRKLLTALDRPQAAAVRAAALTDLVGWDLQRLATASEDELAELAQSVRRWGRLLPRVGVAGLLQVLQAEGLSARLVAQAQGERSLADIRHLAELLNAEQVATGASALGLSQWLEDRITEATTSQTDDRSRRLETDDAVVRILTVHQAKGLEFPVVYLPDLAIRRARPVRDEAIQLHVPRSTHDPAGPGLVRALDVGGRTAPGRPDRVRAYLEEEAAESLRTLYVALTRAQVHITCWWARTDDTPGAAFHRVLFRDPASPQVPLEVRRHDTDLTTVPRLLGADLVVEAMVPAERRPPPARHADPGACQPARFTRSIDQEWRRTSYSALTAAAHDSVVADPELLHDEPPLPEDAFPPEPDPGLTTVSADRLLPGLEQRSPMADLPGGVGFGSLVHAVFEYADPGSADPQAGLQTIVAEQVARTPVPGVTTHHLVTALNPALVTPLGPLFEERTLRDIPARDRLAELDFELPLGSGEHGATIAQVAETLAVGIPPGHLLADYPGRLAAAGLDRGRLRGFLTGSIDATLRIGERYLVVDYKTNRLAPPSTELLLAHYTPQAMAEAMMASHYPLQAVLYAVALHRFLRWRLPGYRPEQHLGGIGYLFVRGMAGAATPRIGTMPCGVFCWQPPASLVTELSDRLGGRS